MKILPAQSQYEPTFKILENSSNGLGDKKIGEKINGLINYQVIEKTKNYVVLRIGFLTLMENKRVF